MALGEGGLSENGFNESELNQDGFNEKGLSEKPSQDSPKTASQTTNKKSKKAALKAARQRRAIKRAEHRQRLTDPRLSLIAALDLVKLLEASGKGEVYMVGGAVRDLLLGFYSLRELERLEDIDLATMMPPSTLHEVLDALGLRYKMPQNGRYMITFIFYKGRVYECATFRRDIYSANFSSLEIGLASSMLEDARRRDFSVNAFYLSSALELFHPLSSMSALRERQLVCIGEPSLRLREDSTRALRAVYFALKLGFGIEEGLLDTMYKAADEVSGIAPHLIQKYLKKSSFYLHRRAIDERNAPACYYLLYIIGLYLIKDKSGTKALLADPRSENASGLYLGLDLLDTDLAVMMARITSAFKEVGIEVEAGMLLNKRERTRYEALVGGMA